MDDYVDYLAEVFECFGPIRVRKMFGGYGVYHDGLMFALVEDDVLYLKVDAENRCYFEQEGLPPFEYNKNGKRVVMSYSQAPDELLEDREMAAEWARRSFEAALRSHSRKIP